jgi:YggT family protein
MIRLLEFIQYLLSLYWWVILASVIMSWLISFNVVNAHNPTVRTIWNALLALTEPLLRPIRNVLGRVLPKLGGIDISPIFLLLGLTLVDHVIIGNLKDLLR